MRALADDPIHAELDALLSPHHGALGADRDGYVGHVHRLTGLVLAQAGDRLDEASRGQLTIAAVFHDLGLWLDDTFDYLDPSAGHAAEHLRSIGRDDWIARVERIIQRHHQLRPVRDDALVEAFRRADLADVSFGLVRRGIPPAAWAQLHARWPIAGFQWRLVRFAARHASASRCAHCRCSAGSRSGHDRRSRMRPAPPAFAAFAGVRPRPASPRRWACGPRTLLG